LSVVRHQALSLVVPLAAGREAEVDAWLREHRRPLQRALTHSSTTHFARWVLLPPSRDEAGQLMGERTLLAFETNFDGELDDHLADLRVVLGALMDGAFAFAEGYPGSAQLPALAQFFREGSLRAAAFYVAHGGLSVPVVRGDAALKLAVEQRLSERSRGSRVQVKDPLELAMELQRVARGLAAERGLTVGYVDRGLPASTKGVLATALERPLSVLLAFLLAPLFELRDGLVRRKQPSFDTPELKAKRDGIGLEEDRVEQNGLTHLVPIKPGWYRTFALRTMVLLVNALAATGALVGRLGGIQTIHFARWVVLPDRRLLFFSNYDGSWEAYLGDFIDKASLGLTMIWTNTLWYPKTRLLLFKGATDEGAFKDWTRAYQVPTQVWYSAYPTLSVGDVLRNAKIRELLGAELDEVRARELLALL
jgi:hypothetical protein